MLVVPLETTPYIFISSNVNSLHSVVTGCCVVKIISVLYVIMDSLHGNSTTLCCRPVLYWTVLNCANRPSDLLTTVSNLTEHGDGQRARELQMELALLRLQFTYAIYSKQSVRPWQTAQCAGTWQKIQWLLYREIKFICRGNHTEHTNTACGQNAELLLFI